MRKKNVTVYCGASFGNDERYQEVTKKLGEWIGKNNYNLVYGGGKSGLMGLIADSVLENGGKVTGIITHFLSEREVAHEGITKLIKVDTMSERKKKMADLADIFIALPGGPGTLEEITEVVSWAVLALHPCPCIFFNFDNYYNHIRDFYDLMVEKGYMKKEAYFATAEELARGGLEAIPPQMISGKHLIYSSPATLAFNSPGAEGFGVKRAGLAVPDSIMLIVAPGCCGRNTSLISSMPEYNDRFFYLMMDETDIVTGRHLKKIPKAVKEICDCCEKKPSVVMICITCVDALLGTDMERVCRKAEEKVDIPVRPCYMYALTREGRKPPMVHVRQSLYSLLEPQKKKGNVVNLLGFFSPLVDDCEMYELLQQAGVKTIHEISRCKDYEEYQTMSQANFNLVLHPEARFAAEDFHDRLKIPFIELRRLYQTDKIENQYRALGQVLGVSFDQEVYKKTAEEAVERFREVCPDASFAVGECMNGDSFELALALVRYGFRVPEIYGTITAENFVYIRHLAELSPNTKVFSNMEPTMLYYDPSGSGVNLTIGKDAGYYHRDQPNAVWNQDRQPYGYAGVRRLFETLTEKVLQKGEKV